MSNFRFTWMNWRVKCVNCKLSGLNCLWHVFYGVAFELTCLWPKLAKAQPNLLNSCCVCVMFAGCVKHWHPYFFFANEFVSLFIYIKFFEISLFVNIILFLFTLKKSTNKPKANHYIYYHVLFVSYNTFIYTISKILF